MLVYVVCKGNQTKTHEDQLKQSNRRDFILNTSIQTIKQIQTRYFPDDLLVRFIIMSE